MPRVTEKNLKLATILAKDAAEVAATGKKPMKQSEAMRQAGYAETTIHSSLMKPQKKSMAQLVQQLLPDEKLLDVHNILLNSKKLQSQLFPLAMEDSAIYELLKSAHCIVAHIVRGKNGKSAYFYAPNVKGMKEALDMAYKLRGDYAPEKHLVAGAFANLTDAELNERFRENEGILARFHAHALPQGSEDAGEEKEEAENTGENEENGTN